MKDIAAKANVSAMTVSLALRNHPSIPPSTRSRIQQIAADVNYRPDPVLSALHSYRRSQNPRRFQGTIAWIDNYPSRNDLLSIPAFRKNFEGASQRADELGYGVERIWLREPSMTLSRIMEILDARNVTGLLLPPQPQAHTAIELDWSRYSVVRFGYTMQKPAFHTVTNHHFHSMTLAINKLKSYGYKKIGMAMSHSSNERVDRLWLSGYITEQYYEQAKSRIPVLMVKDSLSEERGKFIDWFRRYTPDAIVAIDIILIQILHSIGCRIPDDVAFALCGDSGRLGEFPDGISGVDENSASIGATAVDFLVGMIQHNEKGIPAHPITMLIDGEWIEESSVLHQK